jgi:hypothetical protein
MGNYKCRWVTPEYSTVCADRVMEIRNGDIEEFNFRNISEETEEPRFQRVLVAFRISRSRLCGMVQVCNASCQRV